jgi:hypothetical protein
METAVISVSKLCCPVCWNLIEILKTMHGGIVVRGYHATVYPVVLPDWLPPDIVTQMLLRFRQYLRLHLVQLATDLDTKKREPRGRQSNASGISNASSANEGGAVEENFTEDFTGNFQNLIRKNMNEDNTPRGPKPHEPEPYLPASMRILKALAGKVIPKFSWRK